MEPKIYTRAWVRSQGGQVIASVTRGEVTEQLWKTSDGRCWSGNDWYAAGQAIVYQTEEAEWYKQQGIECPNWRWELWFEAPERGGFYAMHFPEQALHDPETEVLRQDPYYLDECREDDEAARPPAVQEWLARRREGEEE